MGMFAPNTCSIFIPGISKEYVNSNDGGNSRINYMNKEYRDVTYTCRQLKHVDQAIIKT